MKEKECYMAETVDLYRVIGIREGAAIRKSRAFLPGENSLEGRQFAFTVDEVLKYAAKDQSKVEVVKVVIPKDILHDLDFLDSIDSNIFMNGVITVQPDKNALFNESIICIEFIEGLGEKR